MSGEPYAVQLLEIKGAGTRLMRRLSPFFVFPSWYSGRRILAWGRWCRRGLALFLGVPLALPEGKVKMLEIFNPTREVPL